MRETLVCHTNVMNESGEVVCTAGYSYEFDVVGLAGTSMYEIENDLGQVHYFYTMPDMGFGPKFNFKNWFNLMTELTGIELRLKVIDAIESLVKDYKMYTAFDVTKLLSEKFIVAHSEVRDFVRDWFTLAAQADCYSRSVINVTDKETGKTLGVYLYHLIGTDPFTYKDARNDVVSVAPKAPVTSVGGNTVVLLPNQSKQSGLIYGKKVEDFGIVNRQNDRVRIPNYVVEMAGFVAGDTLLINYSNSEIVLKVADVGGPSLTVTKDNRVNLTTFWLNKAFLTDKTEFAISIHSGDQGNYIVIR